MSEETTKVSFSVPIKPKKEAPKQNIVSSLFKKAAPAETPKVNISISNITNKKKIAPKINLKEEDGSKNTKESPFLRRLKQHQQGIKPPPPVPTEDAFNENIPIGGFGEQCLRRQGWEPGLKLGEIDPNETDDD